MKRSVICTVIRERTRGDEILKEEIGEEANEGRNMRDIKELVERNIEGQETRETVETNDESKRRVSRKRA